MCPLGVKIKLSKNTQTPLKALKEISVDVKGIFNFVYTRMWGKPFPPYSNISEVTSYFI